MERFELRANRRTVRGKQVKQLRVQGLVPAVVYGPDTPALAIEAPERSMVDALGQAGSTQLIDLFVDDEAKPTMVLARDIQRHVLSGRVLHVDFYQVRLTEKVRTTPRLVIVGESPLVKSSIAVMIHSMSEVDVECLPTDLIDSIPVDVSGLESMSDSVLIGDLPVPEGVTILADLEETVVSLVPVRVLEEEEAEAELEAMEEAEEEAEPED